MIGGYDWILRPTELDWILGVIRQAWPEGVFEPDSQGILLPLQRLLPGKGGFFLYRDMDSYHSWTDKGETPENRAAMIYLIVREEDVTLVTGGPSATVVRMPKTYSSLKDDVLQLILAYQHQHKHRPSHLHLTKVEEDVLAKMTVQEAGSVLYAQLQVQGPREVFRTLLGLTVEWDQPQMGVTQGSGTHQHY